MATERVVEQTRADEYDVEEIPPEAPEGGWTASPTATAKMSAKNNPMISIRWKLDSADEEENADAEGNSVFDNLNFLPKNNPGYRMNAERVQALCHLLDIPTRGTVQAMCDAINAAGQAHIFTKHEIDKDSGEKRVRVAYKEPRGAAKAETNGGGSNGRGNSHREEESPKKKSSGGLVKKKHN